MTQGSEAPERDQPLVACPVDKTLAVIGGKWKPLILYQLRPGPRRFNELRRLLSSVTQRMLTAHLRELETDGVVVRRIYPVIPPHVEYSLTPLGKTLLPILTAIAEWGMEHADRLPSRK